MDKIPDSAACNEAVKLAVKRRFTGLKGFVNGVLRSLVREKEQIRFPNSSIRLSMPEWILSMWAADYGIHVAEEIAAAFLKERPTCVRLNSGASPEETITSLENQGVEVTRLDLSLIHIFSSQGLKMHRVDGITFDYALFTNLSPDHIGPNEHADFQEYLYYKSQIFRRAKIGVLNLDDEHYQEIRSHASCPIYDFSLKTPCDFYADQIDYVSGNGFVGVEFSIKGRYDARVRVGIPGLFNVYNALGAFGIASFLDLPKEKVEKALEHMRVNGRMELVYSSDQFSILVDYAHNAVSMESLLNTLRAYRPKRLVCVFGCGGNRAKDRRYSMGEIGGKLADLCILTADNSRFEKTEDIIQDIKSTLVPTGGAYLEIPDRREAIAYAINHAEEGDMIAVIGKGHEDYQEENGVRHHFLDREVIEKVLAQKKEAVPEQGE